MTTIPITMTDEDFSHLCSNSSRWALESDWSQQVHDGRFEVHGGPDPASQPWKYAYWVGAEYTAVILAKAFLASRDLECQVCWDLAEPGEWVILTDYGYIWEGKPESVTEMQR